MSDPLAFPSPDPPAPWVAVVDDDASVRRALARLLRAEGMQVATFASADEYLATADRDGAPCCLVLDVHLGGASRLNGLELHDHVAASGAGVRVVLITADDVATPDVARRVGEGGYLRKPIQREALLSRLGGPR